MMLLVTIHKFRLLMFAFSVLLMFKRSILKCFYDLSGRKSEQLDELQDSIDRTLKAIYPYLSEGAGWTNPNSPPDSIFRIVPRCSQALHLHGGGVIKHDL
jgi:hypothetical protein